MAPRKKKVISDEPIRVLDYVEPTGPILSSLGIKGRVIFITGEYVSVVWNKTEFKRESGYVRLPNPHKIKLQGVRKID